MFFRFNYNYEDALSKTGSTINFNEPVNNALSSKYKYTLTLSNIYKNFKIEINMLFKMRLQGFVL